VNCFLTYAYNAVIFTVRYW